MMAGRAAWQTILSLWALAAGAAHGMGWLYTSQYQSDSENLLTTWGGQAGLTGLETSLGGFDILAQYRHFQVEDNALGLQTLSEPAPGLLARYALVAGPYGFNAQAGLGPLSGWKDYSCAAEASRRWAPFGRGTITVRAQYGNLIDKDNPLTAALAMRSRYAGMAVNLAAGSWVLELAAGARYHDGIPKSSSAGILEDTSMIPDLPRNRIRSGHAFAYRPLGPFLHLGAFASYSDSHRDFYALIYQSAQAENSYLYFPYQTPLDAYAFGGVLSADLDWEAYALPLGKWSGKVTFPFRSGREQQARSPRGIPFAYGYYDFHGDEPWTSELRFRKSFRGGTGLTLAYRFSLKPYLEYGYFKGQSYRVHAWEIRLGS